MNALIFQITVFLCEALLSGIFIQNRLSPRISRPVQMVLWCEITILLVCLTPAGGWLRLGILTAAELCFVLVMYEDKWLQRLKVFAWKELIVLLAGALSVGLYSTLICKDLSVLQDCTNRNPGYCLLYLLNYSTMISLAFLMFKRVKQLEFIWCVGTQVLLWLGECVTALLILSQMDVSMLSNLRMYWIILAMICMYGSNISIGILAPYLLERIFRANSMTYEKAKSSMEYKYYEISMENDRKLQALSHDISNHIQTVYALLANGEAQKSLELMEELKQRYACVERTVYCANPVVNVILTNKRDEAGQKGIETHIKVKQSLEQLPVSDYDLSTVICNLIDNAIEGCVASQQTNPRMVVEILSKNGYLVIRVLNSCKVSLSIDSTDRLESTKLDNQLHGCGMQIIGDIAKKYRGDFVASAQNGIFTATVVLSLK